MQIMMSVLQVCVHVHVCVAQAGNLFFRAPRLAFSVSEPQVCGTRGEESETARASVGEATREVGEVCDVSEVSEVRDVNHPST